MSCFCSPHAQYSSKWDIKATVNAPENLSQPMCMLFTFYTASFHQTKYWLYNLLGKTVFFHTPIFPSIRGTCTKHPDFQLPHYLSQRDKVSYLTSRWQPLVHVSQSDETNLAKVLSIEGFLFFLLSNSWKVTTW